MTRSRDVADTQDNLGGAVAPFVAAKNIVINGGFDIYQRTSVSTTSSAFGLDRWFTIAAGSASATVLSQQTTGVPNGSRYCMRVAMGASGGYGNQFTFIETSNAAQLWGRTATLSLKIRRNATFAGTLSASVSASPTVDAGSGATWTALSATGVTVASNASLPTGTGSSNWLTMSFQVDVPADGSANSLRVSVAQSQVEAAGAYWEVAQVQLEAGSVATPFTRTGGSIGGELALCQRYYWRWNANSNFATCGIGAASSTTIGVITVIHPVPMRTVVSAIDSSANSTLRLQDQVTGLTQTGASIEVSQQDLFKTDLNITVSGATQYRFYRYGANNSTSAYLGFSAEL